MQCKVAQTSCKIAQTNFLLNAHVAEEHNGIIDNVCVLCGTGKLSAKANVQQHITSQGHHNACFKALHMRHALAVDNGILCCGKSHTARTLASHINKARQSEASGLRCCEQSFAHVYAMKHHCAEEHQGFWSDLCVVCDKPLRTTHEKERHIEGEQHISKLAVSKEYKFVCVRGQNLCCVPCAYSCASEAALHKHLRSRDHVENSRQSERNIIQDMFAQVRENNARQEAHRSYLVEQLESNSVLECDIVDFVGQHVEVPYIYIPVDSASHALNSTDADESMKRSSLKISLLAYAEVVTAFLLDGHWAVLNVTKDIREGKKNSAILTTFCSVSMSVFPTAAIGVVRTILRTDIFDVSVAFSPFSVGNIFKLVLHLDNDATPDVDWFRWLRESFVKQKRVSLATGCEYIQPQKRDLKDTQTIENSAAFARMFFLDESTFHKDQGMHVVTEETKQTCLDSFREVLCTSKEVVRCGVCCVPSFAGQQMRISLDQALLLETEINTFHIQSEIDGVRYALDPSCVQERLILTCEKCAKSLRDGKVPRNSLKFIDIGNPRRGRPDLPNLSISERVVLSRCIVHRTILCLRVKEGAFQHSVSFDKHWKGHVITFQQDPLFLRSIPSLGRAKEFLHVYVVGKISADARLHCNSSLRSALQVRKIVLDQWIRFLVDNNVAYADIEVVHYSDEDCENACKDLIESAFYADNEDSVKGVVSEMMATSDIACGDVQETGQIMQSHVTSREAPHSDVTKSLFQALSAKISAEPVNEYGELHTICLGGFPDLFVTWPQSAIGAEQWRVLLTRANSVFATSAAFLFFLFDVNYRKTLCATTAAAFRASPTRIQRLSDFLEQNDFDKLLEEAINEPKGRVAKHLESFVLPYVQTCTRKMPFSPGMRRASRGPLYGLYRRFGIPSFWITVSPGETDNVLLFKLTLQETNETLQIPSSVHERAKHVIGHPVQCARLFDWSMRAVFTHLFGICDVSDGQQKQRGVFGTPRAFYSVVECQNRGSLHAHAVLWTHLSPELVSASVHEPGFRQQLSEVLDSMITACLDAEGKDLIRKMFAKENISSTTGYPKAESDHTIRQGMLDIPKQYGSLAYHNTVRRCGAGVQTHIGHRLTCFTKASGKTNIRERKCRFAMRSVVNQNRTGVFEVFEEGEGLSKILKVTESISAPPPDVEGFPFHLEDSRPLVFLPHNEPDPIDPNKGGVVVPFSPVLAACCRCNQCVVFLSTSGAGRSVYFYLVKYMTKDTCPLGAVLGLLREAKASATKFPSKATDQSSHRPVQHIMLKLCNKIHRNMEVSSQMAAAVILGQKSEYSSHSFVYVNVAEYVRIATSGMHDENEDEQANPSSSDTDVDCDVTAEEEITAPITSVRDGDTKRVCVSQSSAVNYLFRGPELSEVEPYVYCAIICVVDRCELKAGGSRGKNPNKAFEFTTGHPQFSTSVQRLRTKQCVPVIIGKVPPCPAPDAANTTTTQRKRRTFARFMVALFSPWNEEGKPRYAMNWEGFLQLASDAKVNDRSKFEIMEHFARSLCGPGPAEKLANEYRTSRAETLNETDLAKTIGSELLVSEEVVMEALEEQMISEQKAKENETTGAARNFARVRAELLTACYACSDPVGENPSCDLMMLPPCMDHNSALSAYQQLKHNEKIVKEVAKLDDTAFDLLPEFLRDNTFEGSVTCDQQKVIKFPRLDGEYKVRGPNGESWNLNEKQSLAVSQVEQMLNCTLPECDVHRRVLFLLGGPGTGKSIFATFVSQHAPSITFLMAPTGIAATVIDGRTVHSSLGFPINESLGTIAQQRKDPTKMFLLFKLFEGKRLLIIDEVSMVSIEMLEAIDMRLRQVFGNEDLFGGLTVVCVGDFFQLKPTQGRPLYSYEQPSTKSWHGNIFETSFIIELSEQKRAEKDKEHTKILHLLRTDPRAGMQRFLSKVNVLGTKDAERFADALTIVCSNEERFRMNIERSIQFAKKMGQPVLIWEDCPTDATLETHPERFSLYVHNGPGVINDNIAPITKKIANGTQVVMKAFSSESGVYTQELEMQGVLKLSPRPSLVMCSKQSAAGNMDFWVGKNSNKAGSAKTQGIMQVEPAFAFTFHKVQGITCRSGVIVDLCARPKGVRGLHQLDLRGIYVAISRVESIEDIRILPFDCEGHNHLLRLCRMMEFPALSAARLLTPITYCTSSTSKLKKPFGGHKVPTKRALEETTTAELNDKLENQHQLIRICENGRKHICSGFTNVGNSCFLNAVLVAVRSCPSFCKALEGRDSELPLQKMSAMFTSSSDVVDTKELYEMLAQRFPHLFCKRQQDAHEAYVAIKSLLRDSLLFCVSMIETFTCASCGHTWSKTSQLCTLHVYLNDRPASQQLRNPAVQESIECRCERQPICNGQHALISKRVSDWGSMFCCQVMRFAETVVSRKEGAITFPLGIGPVSLRSVVLHHGRTALSGHYTCLSRDADLMWRHFDDTICARSYPTLDQALEVNQWGDDTYLWFYDIAAIS